MISPTDQGMTAIKKVNCCSQWGWGGAYATPHRATRGSSRVGQGARGNRSRSLWCGSFLQTRQGRINRFRIGWLEHFSAGGGVRGLSGGLVPGPEECDRGVGSSTSSELVVSM